ncbi:MAG: N-terminal acetyltransferase [Watsoniomyces obsoletus]|nr:MAG: N-terminal acetyltransferase [Watsoniomyces obsoletus]
MVLHNPNNWHWVNKDVAPWAKEYLEKHLTGITAEENGVSAKIDKLLSMDGDVDVSQRKGKVITLFDVKLQLEYSGFTATEKDVKGTITIPEVAHDTDEDEYVFDIDIYSDENSKQPVKDLVRKAIVPQLRKRLVQLAPAIITEHGKDLQHAPSSGPSSGTATPADASRSAASAGNIKSTNTATTTTSSQTSNANGGRTTTVNVTTVTDNEEFRTTAAELFQTFTDPQRIAAFTRSPPKVFEGAKTGGKFEIFGGNVSGEYVELEAPTRIVQRWRLNQWPAGHHSTLRITFDQNDQDAVTVMRVQWDGVPIGQEEVTKRNWGEYYVVRLR